MKQTNRISIFRQSDFLVSPEDKRTILFYKQFAPMGQNERVWI
jgi:hypothetical protein